MQCRGDVDSTVNRWNMQERRNRSIASCNEKSVERDTVGKVVFRLRANRVSGENAAGSGDGESEEYAGDYEAGRAVLRDAGAAVCVRN